MTTATQKSIETLLQEMHEYDEEARLLEDFFSTTDKITAMMRCAMDLIPRLTAQIEEARTDGKRMIVDLINRRIDEKHKQIDEADKTDFDFIEDLELYLIELEAVKTHIDREMGNLPTEDDIRRNQTEKILDHLRAKHASATAASRNINDERWCNGLGWAITHLELGCPREAFSNFGMEIPQEVRALTTADVLRAKAEEYREKSAKTEARIQHHHDKAQIKKLQAQVKYYDDMVATLNESATAFDVRLPGKSKLVNPEDPFHGLKPLDRSVCPPPLSGFHSDFTFFGPIPGDGRYLSHAKEINDWWAVRNPDGCVAATGVSPQTPEEAMKAAGLDPGLLEQMR